MLYIQSWTISKYTVWYTLSTNERAIYNTWLLSQFYVRYLEFK